MKKYGIYIFLLFSWCFAHAMQKSPADLLTGAAAFGNLQGVQNNLARVNPNTQDSAGRIPLVEAAKNGHLSIIKLLISNNAIIDLSDKNGLTALGQAARNGHADIVKYLIDTLFAQGKQHQINQKDSSGQTPLIWATLALDKNKAKDYQEIILLLISALTEPRALTFRDKDGLTAVHTAARGGNKDILSMIASNAHAFFPNLNLINDQGTEKKGRTPLAEAIRASKDGIIHIDLENQTFQTPNEFYTALQEPKKGIAQFLYKEQNKLSLPQVIDQINVLKKYKADSRIPDATGHTLDYYINNVLLITEKDRITLLQTLGFPITPRVIKYTPNDLSTAIKRLVNLNQQIAPYNIGQALQLASWTITRSQQEQNQTAKFNLLRIAMGMLSAAKEQAKDKIKNESDYKKFENDIDDIRTILRDSALIISGRASISKP